MDKMLIPAESFCLAILDPREMKVSPNFINTLRSWHAFISRKRKRGHPGKDTFSFITNQIRYINLILIYVYIRICKPSQLTITQLISKYQAAVLIPFISWQQTFIFQFEFSEIAQINSGHHSYIEKRRKENKKSSHFFFSFSFNYALL